MRRKFYIGLAVFLLAVLLAWAIADVWSTAALEASIEKIRAAGDPVTMEELMADAKPPTPGVGADGRVAEFLYGSFADGSAAIVDGVKLDPQRHFAKFGENSLWDVRTHAVEFDKLWAPWTPETEADARKVVDANHDFLNRIHEIAALPLEERGVMLQRSGEGRTTIYAFGIPNLLAMRGVQNLLSFEAALAAKSGDEPGAARALLHQLRWARHVKSTSETLIAEMITTALEAIAASNIGRAVQFVQFSPESAKALDEELKASGGYAGLTAAFKMDRLVSLDLRYDNALQEQLGASAFNSLVFRLYRNPLRFWMYHDLNTGLGIYEEMLAIIGLTYPEFAAGLPAINQRIGKLKQLTTPITAIRFPNVARCRVQVDESDTLLSLARVALALNRFHADTGVYPESLDALAPTYIETVPLDVFTEAPFPYEREGNGYVMYSVGAPETNPKGPDGRLSVRVM